jgi:hypothetical protein
MIGRNEVPFVSVVSFVLLERISVIVAFSLKSLIVGGQAEDPKEGNGRRGVQARLEILSSWVASDTFQRVPFAGLLGSAECVE